MKLKITRLLVLLFCLAGTSNGRAQTVVYTSPNASTDAGVTVPDMVHLDFRTVYQLGADLSGGIIGDVQSGGSIRLEVFEYDPNRPQGIGDLLYGKFTQGTATTYGGIAETHSVTGTQLGSAIIILTDNIKALGQKSSVYTTGGDFSCLPAGSTLLNAVMKEGFAVPTAQCTALERNQPVIIRVTQVNATASSVKIPGIGVYSMPAVLTLPPFARPFGPVSVCAHRGNWESNLAPENTDQALDAALADNVDMIELDIAMSSDGVPVIFHDNGLVKRTTLGGAVAVQPASTLVGLNIRNRFDYFLPGGPGVVLISLSQALDRLLLRDPKKTWINLDKSANDMATFKKIYQVVSAKGMLDRVIFKGRFNPVTDDPNNVNLPTVAGFRQAFADMFPSSSPADRDKMIRDMYYTPVLFDDATGSSSEAVATLYYQFMNGFVQAQFADGFELNFKALPTASPRYATDDNSHIILLRTWQTLNNQNFVNWVHSKNLPVGIFASEPEVGAVPQYVGGPTNRDATNLVSGTVFEDQTTFQPKVQDQASFDFRGNPEFYTKAGADYVITDRPDQVLAFLRAIHKNTH